MAFALPHRFRFAWRPGPAATLVGGLGVGLALALALVGPARLIAQIEGDRGIQPIATSRDIQVSGIEVEATGDSGQEAREAGWKLAAKKAWEQIGGPAMGDGQIESMVSAIVVQREQIGPHRYIATLGVIFDRSRAGQFVGAAGGAVRHSAPLLVIPVLYQGGTAQVFEVRGPWQQAWAAYNPGSSPVDYVRPVGAGGDSLILTAGQPGRRSRAWWRTLLDQFGASDVIVPEARLVREWPGGPVHGTFTARYGPDNAFLSTFELTAPNDGKLPAMLAQAVQRFDQLYTQALADGLLRPDPTLNAEPGALDPSLAALIAAGQQAEAAPIAAATSAAAPTPEPTATAAASTVTIQFASPDAGAVDDALAAVRGSPGVSSAATTSLAMGGTSIMRVAFAGDLTALAAALKARGYTVAVGNGALTIRK